MLKYDDIMNSNSGYDRMKWGCNDIKWYEMMIWWWWNDDDAKYDETMIWQCLNTHIWLPPDDMIMLNMMKWWNDDDIKYDV